MLLSSAILLMILFPTLLSILLSLPRIQNKIIDATTLYVSDFLGTEVAIGHLNISMLGDVEIDNFLTCDLQGDTLLYVKKMKSSLAGFSLSEKELHLGNSSIEGGKLNLVARMVDGESVMNIKQIVSLISNGSGEKPLQLFLNSVDFKGVDISIRQLEKRNPSYGVDYGDIELMALRGGVSDLHIDGPRISTNVRKLAFRERSGFVMKQLAGELKIGKGALVMDNIFVNSGWSRFQLGTLMLSGREWTRYRDFKQNVLMEVDLQSGYISSNDIAYFAPKLKDWDVKLEDLDVQAVGLVDGLSIDVENISYGLDSHISTKLELTNASSIDSAYAIFDLDDLVIDPTDAKRFMRSVGGDKVPSDAYEMIDRIGRVVVEGHAEGELDKIAFDGVLSSQLGDVVSKMSVDLKQRGQISFAGEVGADGFDLGRLLDRDLFGLLSVRNVLSGTLRSGVPSSLKLTSSIDSFVINDYDLRNTKIEANIEGDNVDGSASFNDPSLKVDIVGGVKNFNVLSSDQRGAESKKSGIQAVIDIESKIREINFKELGFNQRDDKSIFAADIKISGSGYDIDDIAGALSITDAQYLFNDKSIATNEVVIDMKESRSGRIFTLESEFADVVMNMSGSPSSNFAYLNELLIDYLPALYDKHKGYNSESLYGVEGVDLSDSESKPIDEKSDEEGDVGVVASPMSSNHLSLVNIKLHNITPIAEAFDSDFEASVDTKGLLLFDPVNREFTVTVSSSYVERNALLAIGLDAQLSNHGDSISLFGRAKELFVGTSLMQNSSVAGGANNDQINLNIEFQNEDDNAAAHIYTQMTVCNTPNLGREYRIKLLPSTISNATQEWSLRSQGISINSGGIDIEKMVVESSDQSLVIDGRASSSYNDKVDVELNNFDLSVLSSFVSRMGYRLHGYTKGEAVISSALRDARIEADVSLDSVTVNNIKSPDLRLLAQWDSKGNQARLHLLNRINQDTLIRGYYIPTRVMYYAKLSVDSLNMNLIDPPLDGAIRDTKGYADVDVIMTGERRGAQLEGEIRCYDLETTIGYTGVRYSVDEGVISVSNNTLSASGLTIKDNLSGGVGSGLFDLTVDLNRLNNVSYDLRVQPSNMLVLDTHEDENDLFYGRVGASGVARIMGDRNNVKINVTAMTDGDSQFFMPLNSKSSISQADFITFVEPKIEVDTTNVILRKRESFKRQQIEEQGGANLDIDLSLQVRPNTDVQLVIDPTMGDVMRAKGDGNFNIHIEPTKNIFEIYGDYTISEGNYLFTLGNIVNKRFTIDPGSSIQWNGSPMDALLNIDAVYKLKTSLQPLMSDESTRAVPVDCVINLSDRLLHPDVLFRIELPSSDAEQQAVVSNLLNDQESISRQFFYLMLTNSFIPESSGVGSDLGVSATAATGFELLANQLSNWLSTSNYNVVLRYRPESELTGDEFDFGFSKGWIDNRLLVELEGNYIMDNKQAISEDMSNFMGEAYITWLIDPVGALRLRGFTQTVDRYDENQGLQETGVGVYYREDFENFKDLRQRVKARFAASPERLEKRAQRRGVREEEKRVKKEQREKKRSSRRRAKSIDEYLYHEDIFIEELPDEEYN